ncbi:MAG: hypothetical protein JWN66_3860 [Sphingomonas bacterium]|uniref:hypothetical protein n=1 Tax=Sphingomonas bacterium TaxID=1895847 RepID=UPI00260DD61C|nr:hypothetical protein [Sphingomonas bacterium]MDB5706744.1 hypothetical protein [Sphingomonas bacterium]
MLLAALIFLTAQEAAPNCRTRAACDAGIKAVIDGWDTDRDGRLNRAEWDRMGEIMLARISPPAPPDALTEMRKDIAADFRWEDGNGDGYVTREEMLKVRLAVFSCLDGNGDGTISDEEKAAREDRCKPF